MKIAVTSQNRTSVTAHAGRCRKFRIFNVEGGQVAEKRLLELPKDQSFHELSSAAAHPLDEVDVLLVGGMGPGLASRQLGFIEDAADVFGWLVVGAPRAI